MEVGIGFIGTPIGDTQDITRKALDLLNKGKTLVCEDTRKSKDILERLGVNYSDKRFISFHEHSGEQKLKDLVMMARQDLVLYLSDAGSPLISDPAYPLVLECLKEDVPFCFASGITAPVYALENSGLPPIPFSFHGFFPREAGKIKEYMSTLANGTHLFFEGVSRVEKTLKIFSEVVPEADVVVARELTKSFETFHRFKARDYEKEEITYKGEFVLLVHISGQVMTGNKITELAEGVLASGGKPKDVAKLIAEILGRKSKDIYQELSRN